MNAISQAPSKPYAKAWRWLLTAYRTHRVELRLAVRVTVATLLTYVLSLLLNVPQVLWTVLTAVVMSQLSLGKSLKTAVDYFFGTVGGAVYSGLVSAFVPHQTELQFLIVLTLSIAPLAFLGAIWPRLSVAPFTAVMVLLAPTITHASPLQSAFYRVIEVGLGGVTALFVSFFVLPSRAQNLGVEAAAQMLRLMAAVLRRLLAGCAEPLDVVKLHEIQSGLGPAFVRLETIADEARRERVPYLRAEPNLTPLLRTMLRLRHDLVIIGRAVAEPLPEEFRKRLYPWINEIARSAAEFAEESAAALSAGEAPDLARFEKAVAAYDAEIAATRAEGLTRKLSGDDVERLFGLGFAFEQLRQDFRELSRWMADFSPARAAD
ncbi:FUSC family protein [Methylocella sp.]|jgi:uncharacterized membrane protein YccC|uniref:FUSC family protein n=1 Tax=Methylocella sp. TaxID=1978226 RepID=UPI003C28CA9E